MSIKFDSTYSAVLSLAEQLIGEGKYDSTYSAVLAIYQNLTSDVDTKFDSVYSIVVNIAEGIENGSINIGGGSGPILEKLITTIISNGTYQFRPSSGKCYNQVDITVDIPNETLTQTLTTNGTYDYAPSVGFFNGANITVDVPRPTSEELNKTITTNGTYQYTPDTDYFNSVNITVEVEGGGGSGSEEEDFSPKIRFFDYEGNMVEEWDFETAKTKTELPAFTDTDLLNQTGWNADFDDINWVIEHNTDLAVGALYRPNDNKTHIVVDIKPENLNTVLFIQTLDGFEIDWGDGTVEDVDTINGYPQHTYDSPGSKDIKISGNWNPQWGVGSISLTAKTYNGFPNSYYFQQITNIHCGIKLGYYWFKYLGNLKYLTFVEDEVVYNSNYFDFSECDNLKIISLPKGSGYVPPFRLRNYNIEVICNPVDLNVGGSFGFGSSIS
jgi:hypothetical protein